MVLGIGGGGSSPSLRCHRGVRRLAVEHSPRRGTPSRPMAIHVFTSLGSLRLLRRIWSVFHVKRQEAERVPRHGSHELVNAGGTEASPAVGSVAAACVCRRFVVAVSLPRPWSPFAATLWSLFAAVLVSTSHAPLWQPVLLVLVPSLPRRTSDPLSRFPRCFGALPHWHARTSVAVPSLPRRASVPCRRCPAVPRIRSFAFPPYFGCGASPARLYFGRCAVALPSCLGSVPRLGFPAVSPSRCPPARPRHDLQSCLYRLPGRLSRRASVRRPPLRSRPSPRHRVLHPLLGPLPLASLGSTLWSARASLCQPRHSARGTRIALQ